MDTARNSILRSCTTGKVIVALGDVQSRPVHAVRPGNDDFAADPPSVGYSVRSAAETSGWVAIPYRDKDLAVLGDELPGRVVRLLAGFRMVEGSDRVCGG